MHDSESTAPQNPSWLYARSANQPTPPWLDQVADALGQYRGVGNAPSSNTYLDAALQGVDQAHYEVFETEVCTERGAGEPRENCLLASPSTLMRMVRECLALEYGLDGHLQRGSGLPQDVEQNALQLLKTVAKQRLLSPGSGWSLGSPLGSVELPVILLAGQTGVIAKLQLALVYLVGANLALVPAPAQFLTPLSEVFAHSLTVVNQWLRERMEHQKGSTKDFALVWDLIPQRDIYAQLNGPSASASIALGCMWLMGHWLDQQWKEPLAYLDLSDMRNLYLSAELTTTDVDGGLAPIGGATVKDGALHLRRELAGADRPLPLHVAEGQIFSDPIDSAMQPKWCTHKTLLALVLECSKLNAPPTEEQQVLKNHLQAPLKDLSKVTGTPLLDPSCAFPMHPPPALVLDEALSRTLKQLASVHKGAQRPEVRTELHYALQRWAEHGQGRGGLIGGRGGLVHQRFVRLQLQASSLQAGIDATQPGPQDFHCLEQLLNTLSTNTVHGAVLVEGEPGSGKTWLFSRHEQALCEQLIADLPPPQSTRTASLPVVPLYLSLRDLPPEEDDPVAFFRNKLAALYPYERIGLRALFAPRAPGSARATRRFSWRVLIDGLNEIRVLQAVDRQQRVRSVVLRLWKHLQPDLPMILGSRPGQGWNLDDAHEGFTVALATLKRWRRVDIAQYLGQRWAATHPERVQAFMSSLQAGSAHEQLLGLPLFLNIQCELWEAGAINLLNKRSHLLAAMLWLRLHQELNKPGSRVSTPGMIDLATEVNPANHFVQALRSGSSVPPPEFARQGHLLKGLFAVAKQQWLQYSQVDPQARGQVALPRAQAEAALREAGLTDRADRDAWFGAVQDLGLGMLDVNIQQFAFAHQVFGEWLASQQLFYSGAVKRQDWEAPQPNHWSSTGLLDLQREIAPPALQRTAAQELDHQREMTRQAWQAVPIELFARWHREGIALPMSDALQATLNQAKQQPVTDGNLLDLYQNKKGILSNKDGEWRFNTNAFGEYLYTVGQLPGIASATNWFADAQAWALLCTSNAAWPPIQDVMKEEIAQVMGSSVEQVEKLWRQDGRLREPPPGALDDIVPLALESLAESAAWWQWLTSCAQAEVGGAWALLSRCLRELQPVDEDSLWAASTARLLQVQADCARRDPRQCIQAGLALGLQGAPGTARGDNQRYERAGFGLRLKRQGPGGARQWIACGGPAARYHLGDCILEDEHTFDATLDSFEMAAFPVTVAEYAAFVQAADYTDPKAPWWRACGSAGQQWLIQYLEENAELRPRTWRLTDFNNPLQPVSGVTWFEATAYTHWAQQHVYGTDRCDDGLKLALPTEWQWEAAVRGLGSAQTPLAWPGCPVGDGQPPDPMLFNHMQTGWKRTTPVGCFGQSTTALGLNDVVGNVWEWCANVYHPQLDTTDNNVRSAASDLSPRTFRGGSYDYAATRCRVGSRAFDTPAVDDVVLGFRLVRVRVL